MSSAASISAAKRRRVPQPTFTSQVSTIDAQQQQPPRPPKGPVRVNPMAILENHELRLREIEGKSTSAKSDNDKRNESIASSTMEIRRELDSIKVQLSAPSSSSDARVDALIKENSDLQQALSNLQTKFVELSNMKDIVINIQSSIIPNADNIEFLKADFETSKTASESVIAAADVSQEIEDVTVTMSTATIAYDEDQNSEMNVTFSAKEDGNKLVPR